MWLPQRLQTGCCSVEKVLAAWKMLVSEQSKKTTANAKTCQNFRERDIS